MAELLNNPDYLYSLVEEIENKFPVDKLTLCGESVWNAIRLMLCGAHMWSYNELGGIEAQSIRKCLPIYEKPAATNRNKSDTYYLKEMEFSFLLSNLKSISGKDVLFFDAIDCYTVNEDGEAASSIFDPFWDYFKEFECISMLPFDNKNRKIRFKRDTVFYRNISDRFVDNTSYSSRVRSLKELMLFLKRNNIPTPFTSNKLESWVKSIYIRGDMFAKILSELRPKLVFITSFRSSERMAVVRACKLLKIPVIEVQHGILGPEYYQLRVNNHSEWVPNAFWLWGDTSLRKMKTEGSEGFVDYLVGGKPNIINHLSNIRNTKKTTSNISKILFIEQYTHGNFSGLIKNTIAKLMKYGSDWQFELRLHPKSIHLLNKYKEELSGLNVSIDLPTFGKLYDVLLSVDAVVAESSTVAYEANALGRKVVVYGNNAKSFFADEIEIGAFSYAKAETEIPKKIISLQDRTFVSSSFFNNDLDNFYNALNFCKRLVS